MRERERERANSTHRLSLLHYNCLSTSNAIKSLRVGLRPQACCNSGFESRRDRGCLSLVSVVCCQTEASANGQSLVQGSSTDCIYVIECDQIQQWLSNPTESR